LRDRQLKGSAFVSRHSNCLVVHYQNEQPNYQQRKENNDDDRNNGIPASGRLAIGRFGSGFLRRSYTQQKAHLIPRSLNLYAFAFAYAFANSIPGRCRRHRPGLCPQRRSLPRAGRSLALVTSHDGTFHTWASRSNLSNGRFAAALPAVPLPDIRHAMFAALRLD
jgi:hypothetical protein